MLDLVIEEYIFFVSPLHQRLINVHNALQELLLPHELRVHLLRENVLVGYASFDVLKLFRESRDPARKEERRS